jgi:hypothetical protein
MAIWFWNGNLLCPTKGAGFLDATPLGLTISTIRPLERDDTHLVRIHNSTAEK